MRLASDFDYKILQQDHVGNFMVSTIWLGLDHNFSFKGPPIIFESMVFDQFGRSGFSVGQQVDCRRYATQQEAMAGHAELLAQWTPTTVRTGYRVGLFFGHIWGYIQKSSKFIMEDRYMSKRILLGVLVALSVVLFGSGCSVPSTAPDEVYVHKASGITEGKEAKGCVPAATREINWGTGWGDDYFAYPKSQRYYDFLKSEADGSDSDRFVVVSSDGQQLTVPGSVFFTLNTDCDTLQSFHDLLGNREQAYMIDGQTTAGWSKVLNLLFKQPIDNALDTVAKKYTWKQLRFDLAVKDEMAKAVNEALKREVNAKIKGDFDYFLDYAAQIQQPIAPEPLVKIEQDREANVSQAAANQAKAEADAAAAEAAAIAQKAQKDAELAVAQKEAAILAAKIRSYGGPEAYAKYMAIEKGINPWQPSYGNSLVAP